MKMKYFGLIETKLFHFHRIFKNVCVCVGGGGNYFIFIGYLKTCVCGGGGSSEHLKPHLDPPLWLCEYSIEDLLCAQCLFGILLSSNKVTNFPNCLCFFFGNLFSNCLIVCTRNILFIRQKMRVHVSIWQK